LDDLNCMSVVALRPGGLIDAPAHDAIATE
jgi:hypothetical protein